jgi:putative glutamine amidotransferase
MDDTSISITGSMPSSAHRIAAPTGRPIVLVPACNRLLGDHPFHIAGKKYIDAVRLAGCTPLVLPASTAEEIPALLALADGVLLTGSPSNVHPSRFGQSLYDASLPLDETRDAMTLALIPQVLALGLPLLAICRGAQEVNVALGGTLHQAVQELDPYQDHRADPAAPVAVQYGPKHEVQVQPGGMLAELLPQARFAVNSVHGQAVDRLAAGARIEALAPDGLVEAYSLPQARGFALCVQWHPEWQAASNPVSMQLLRAFGAACRSYRERPRGPLPAGYSLARAAAQPTDAETSP